MSLLKISRYRNELMGFAILWTMLFHSGVYIPNILLPVRFVKDVGYGAVDIFFFLSGFGLFYSWFSVRRSPGDFFKRRLLRVIPSYWIVIIIYFFIYKGTTLLDLLYMLTGLDFFLFKHLFFWFIPSILCCYAIFPLIITLINFNDDIHSVNRKTILVVVSTIVLSIIITLTDLYYLLIFTLRLPIFIFGIYAGYLFVNNFKIFYFENKKFNIAIMLLGIFILIFILSFTTINIRWRFGLWWYPFILIIYPLCLFIATSFEFMDKYLKNYFYITIRKFISFCGRYSLEIFLIHAVIFAIFPGVLEDFSPYIIHHKLNIGRVPEYGFYALFAICLSPLLSKIATFYNFRHLAARQKNVADETRR